MPIELDKQTNLNKDLLELKNVKKYFPIEKGISSMLFSKGGKIRSVKAVDGVSITVAKGEKFGICGESGCGKTTTARVITGLDFETDGQFFWKGKIYHPKHRMNKLFRKNIQFIFQNPFSSLNPRMRVGAQISHALIIQKIYTKERRKIHSYSTYGELAFVFWILIGAFLALIGYTQNSYMGISGPDYTLGGILSFIIAFSLYYLLKYRPIKNFYDDTVIQMLDKIGLNPPKDYYNKYPHELSGGERQRIAIARALILNPELLVADEPTSMLDVSIRASILDLIQKLKTDFNLTIILITHDLATAKYFCDRVAIMYVGKIVEIGSAKEIFKNPKHPYTKALLNAIPVPEPNYKMKEELPVGEVPDAVNPPPGCRFHPRCVYARDNCSKDIPELSIVETGHEVACFYPLSHNS